MFRCTWGIQRYYIVNGENMHHNPTVSNIKLGIVYYFKSSNKKIIKEKPKATNVIQKGMVKWISGAKARTKSGEVRRGMCECGVKGIYS